MVLLTVVLALLLALVVIVVGMAQVQGLPASLSVRDRVGASPTLWRVVGWLELVAAAGLVMGVAAPLVAMARSSLVGLAVVFAGALVAHLRVKDWPGMVPATVLLIWAGVLLALVPRYRQ
jgi:uncharacterized membrane protein YphA (DoxX/SURF4 family)